MAEGAPINTDNNGLILFNAPLYVHSSTISQNEELLIASSRGVAEYLEFPGATPVNGHRKLHRSWSEPLKVDTERAMD